MTEHLSTNPGDPRRILGSHGKVYVEGPEGTFTLPDAQRSSEPTAESIKASLLKDLGAITLTTDVIDIPATGRDI